MADKLGLLKYDKDIAVDLLTNMYEDKTGENFGVNNIGRLSRYWV